MKRPLIIIFLILFLDQAVKVWVKTHMFLGQEYHIIGHWFIIHFTENNGMAYGMEFAGNYGKLFLSLFRVLAAIGGSWYLYTIVKAKQHNGYITCVALILAGAIGNIIDSLFYGKLFSESTFELAQFLPANGGYSAFLHGRVVDMLYFPVIEGHFPAWFPFWGTEEFLFFRPVFNIADSSITIGVIAVILFQKRFFKEEVKADEETKEQVVAKEDVIVEKVEVKGDVIIEKPAVVKEEVIVEVPVVKKETPIEKKPIVKEEDTRPEVNNDPETII